VTRPPVQDRQAQRLYDEELHQQRQQHHCPVADHVRRDGDPEVAGVDVGRRERPDQHLGALASPQHPRQHRPHYTEAVSSIETAEATTFAAAAPSNAPR